MLWLGAKESTARAASARGNPEACLRGWRPFITFTWWSGHSTKKGPSKRQRVVIQAAGHRCSCSLQAGLPVLQQGYLQEFPHPSFCIHRKTLKAPGAQTWRLDLGWSPHSTGTCPGAWFSLRLSGPQFPYLGYEGLDM